MGIACVELIPDLNRIFAALNTTLIKNSALPEVITYREALDDANDVLAGAVCECNVGVPTVSVSVGRLPAYATDSEKGILLVPMTIGSVVVLSA